MRRKPLPTWERVREVINYDPATGIVTWRIPRQKCTIGKTVGTLKGDKRYFEICIDKSQMRLHRVIFFYMTGRWPVTVDHINCNGLDNRWVNLREATYSQQNANRRPSRKGLKGVYRQRNRWRAGITHQLKTYRLGYFRSEESAHAAYAQKARELFGEFARNK